ncbi:MAG: hypothetical protein K9M19_06990 [Candidatus Marinimicrobia bacterium]|nr:hypothetical protein [Candidatus Neomarinimicrobiota bacterium]
MITFNLKTLRYLMLLLNLIFVYSACNDEDWDLDSCWSLAPDNYKKYARKQPVGWFLGEDYNKCLFQNIARRFSGDTTHGILIERRESTHPVQFDTTILNKDKLNDFLSINRWKFICVAVIGIVDSSEFREYKFVVQDRASNLSGVTAIYSLAFYLMEGKVKNWIPDISKKNKRNIVIEKIRDDWGEKSFVQTTQGIIWAENYMLVTEPPFHKYLNSADSNVTIIDRNEVIQHIVCKNRQADSLYRDLLNEFEFMPFQTTERQNFSLLFSEIDRQLPAGYDTMPWETFSSIIKNTINKYWLIQTCSIQVANNIPSSIRMKLVPRNKRYHSSLYTYCIIRNQQWLLMYGVLESSTILHMPPSEKQLFGD